MPDKGVYIETSIYCSDCRKILYSYPLGGLNFLACPLCGTKFHVVIHVKVVELDPKKKRETLELIRKIKEAQND